MVHQRRNRQLHVRVGLEVTALSSIKAEYWIAAVQEADTLLVQGGDVWYLCRWMRESGLADLLPSLR